MILVDTSIWIDHLHRTDPDLSRHLASGAVYAHPFVTGELALGNIRSRRDVLGMLDRLPDPLRASDHEVRVLVEEQHFHGTGLSLVDVHLLASTLLTPGCALWTRDKGLAAAARRLGVAHPRRWSETFKSRSELATDPRSLTIA